MKNEQKIPIGIVIQRMNSEDRIIASAARDYFYLHYATQEDRKELDRMEKRNRILVFCFWAVSTILIGIALFF